MANIVPSGSQPVSATTSGTTGALTVTLGGNTNTGRTMSLTGLTYQSTGATAAAVITITATYAPVGNGAAITLGTWSYFTGTTVATPNAPLEINLLPPMQSSAPITGVNNTTTTTATGSITVTASAAGAGATGAVLSAWGFMQ